MEKLIQEFIQYCFDHGSFLKNHKEFGEMSRKLVSEAIKSDLGVQERAIARTITYREPLPELLIPIPEELTYKSSQEVDLTKPPVVFVLVYRFYRKVGEKEYLYTFSGGRHQEVETY